MTDDAYETEVLQKVTSEPRSHIIADIVGHPKGAPSVKELDYTNPSIGEDVIRNHLTTLQEVGMVEELVIETGDRVHERPYKFYRITDHARDLFDQNGFFPKEPWKRQYDRIEKSDQIQEVQDMPRPEP